jgi:hypothetical protein
MSGKQKWKNCNVMNYPARVIDGFCEGIGLSTHIASGLTEVTVRDQYRVMKLCFGFFEPDRGQASMHVESRDERGGSIGLVRDR